MALLESYINYDCNLDFIRERNTYSGTYMSYLNEIRSYLRSFVCPMEWIIDQIEEESSTFDLGCGTGYFLKCVCEKKRFTKVGGCEIDGKLVEHTRQSLLPLVKGADLNLVISASPPREVGDYSHVTLVDVLHHIPQAEQFDYLTTVFSNMSDGCKFYLKDIDAGSPLVWFNRLHDFIFSGNGFQEISKQDCEALLDRIGFKIIEVSVQRKSGIHTTLL